MELELKHIAPYLPYGLHIEHTNGTRLIICGAFKKYNADDFFTYSLLNWEKDVKSKDAKPILIPLSYVSDDLFEEIGFADEEDFIACVLNGDILYNNLIKLVSKHFDVFGLIDAGLAIDKNTLSPNVAG